MRTPIFTLLLLICLCVESAHAEVYSGTCGAEGDNLTWELSSDYVLTISGTGAMAEYNWDSPWYDYKEMINSVIVGEGVTTISSTAFRDFIHLQQCSLPSTLTSIGNEAFCFCFQLMSLEIPEACTSFGYNPFNLVPNIVIKDASILPYNGAARSVNGYVDGYFVYADATKHSLRACSSAANGEIVLDDAIERIEYMAFAQCEEITNIHFGSHLQYIGEWSLNGCRGLEGLQFQEGLIEIADDAFGNCFGLQYVYLPNSLTTLGHFAIGNCPYLRTIHFGESLTTVGTQLFDMCPGLDTIYAPMLTPPVLDNTAFAAADLSHVICHVPNQSVSLYQEAPVWREMNIKATDAPELCIVASGTCGYNLTWELSCDSVLTIRGEGVMDYDDPTIISPWQYWSDMIKTLEIEEGVMSIAVNAFFGCRSLTSAHLPNSVTMIGSGAFTYCEKLTSIVVPANVFYLDRCVFANCESLTSVTFAGNLEGIDENCFQGCETLESIVLPNSVISIGSSAFIGCRNMRSITLPSSLTTMGYGVFCDCRSLESITIPRSTTDIGEAVFFACDSLSSVTVEEGNPVYDSRDNCNAIIRTATNTLHAGCRKTVIPTSVTNIGNAAFQNISTLTSFSIPNNVTAIGGYAFSGTGLTTISFPNTITNLTDYVVGDCKDLRSIIIPASVTNVGWWLFAFDYNLDTIVCNAVTPPAITEYTFDYFYNQQTCHLYVPRESIDMYKAADGWKDFLNIQSVDDVPTSLQNSSSTTTLQKFFRNGQLFILRDGKTYTVQGQEVR